MEAPRLAGLSFFGHFEVKVARYESLLAISLVLFGKCQFERRRVDGCRAYGSFIFVERRDKMVE